MNNADQRARAGYRRVAPVRRLVTVNEPSLLALILIQFDVASLRLAMRSSAKFSAPLTSERCNCHVSVSGSACNVFNVSAAPPLAAPLFRIATRGSMASNSDGSDASAPP